MSIDRLGKELEALGVSGRDVRCLLLLPQVYVGWASQRRDLPALEALLDTTASRAGFGSECLALARGWLFERPTRAQFQSGFALLRVLRRAPDSPLITSSDLLEAMLWASRAAQLDREPRASGYGPASAAARRALIDLEAWLEVDTEEVWIDLLAEPSEELPRSSKVLPPSFESLSDDELENGTALLAVPPEPELEEDAALLDAVPEEDEPASEQEAVLLEAGADDEPSGVLRRRQDDSGAPASVPFPLVRTGDAAVPEPFPLVRRPA